MGDGGPPRTPDERRRRDRRHVVVASVAGLVLAVPTLLVGVQAVEVFRGVDFGSAAPDEDPAPGRGTPDGGAGGPSTVEVPTLDLDALEGRDATFGVLLDAVDRSERAMIDAQDAMARAFARSGDDLDAAFAGASQAAGAGQRVLQELRSDVAQPVGGDEEAGELRDRYLTHLDAWVRFLVAVEREPDLLLDETRQRPLNDGITSSGVAFADVLRDLPDDVGDEVREVADAIAERGFPELGPEPDQV